jgi:hypothetical protein
MTCPMEAITRIIVTTTAAFCASEDHVVNVGRTESMGRVPDGPRVRMVPHA